MTTRQPLAIIATLALSAASLWGAASPRTDATRADLQRFSITLPEDVDVDSLLSWEIQNIVVDTLTERASDLYRQIIFLKTESDDKELLYSTVYQAFEQSTTAISYAEPQSSQWSRLRSQLLGIDADLERGAYYYSSAQRQDDMGRFAQAFIDIQLMEEFKNHPFTRDESSFPLITYIAASRAYNTRDFDKAIDYFRLYFSTGTSERREQVFLFMGQACLNTNRYDLAITTMRDALRNYPDSRQYMMIGIQACVDGNRYDALAEFLDPVLAIEPDNEQLLLLKGKLQEDTNDYLAAISTYTRLDELSPMKLNYSKHLALSYYNYAVFCFNDALNEEDEKKSRRLRDKANTYFQAATQSLENVLGSDPMAVKYLKALGVSYLCLGEKGRFESVNQQLSALGEDALSEVFMPPVIKEPAGKGAGPQGLDVPQFRDYCKEYVKPRIAKWVERNEFETSDAYMARVNDLSIKSQIEALEIEAQGRYLEQYSSQLQLTDMSLEPYDTANQTFMIRSSYGPITVHVPLADNEAENFKANWEAMRFSDPTYFIVDEQPRIGTLKVHAPNGKTYQYDNSVALAYQQSQIKIDWVNIMDEVKPTAQATTTPETTVTTIEKLCDVDRDIPTTNTVADRMFALVIANENYENAVNVTAALRDGEYFAKYVNKTLGVPESNVKLLKNATYGHLLGAIKQLKNTVNAFDGQADVIVYYAGHGIPDDSSKDAFLMPVDATPTLLESCISLESFYDELNNLNSNSVTVFLDACFSGSTRESSPIVAARGIAIKPKDVTPKGNMFVLSAASDSETAMPYAEMNHGMFTYFLLKKLQESQGDVTLKDLSEYVITQVKQTSVIKNQKLQTPTVRTSGAMSDNWSYFKLIK